MVTYERGTCFLCRESTSDGNYVFWILHDGRLAEVCGICLDKYAGG